MKRNLLIIAIMFLFGTTWSQENRFSLNGGYVFANIEDTDTGATGWRIQGVYEFNPGASTLSHGIAFGYMTTTSDFTSNTQTSNYKNNTYPIYYAPKLTFGQGKMKLFVKGALGTHITSLKRTGTLAEIKTTDMGFYGGASAGVMADLSDKVFLNAEYEWAYMSNTSYRDGFVNSAMVGIGIRF